MKNKKHTTPDKEVYSKEELAYFKTLESDIERIKALALSQGLPY